MATSQTIVPMSRGLNILKNEEPADLNTKSDNGVKEKQLVLNDTVITSSEAVSNPVGSIPEGEQLQLVHSTVTSPTKSAETSHYSKQIDLPSLKVTPASRYANLSISETVVTDLPPERSYSYANWSATKPVVVEFPPCKPESEATGHYVVPSRNASGQSMSSQTEWDMWGIPVVRDTDHTIRPSSCNCSEAVKMVRELRREMERDAVARDDQNRAKFNFLREQKVKADEERDRMRSTIAALSKKVADNTANMAEQIVRTQRGGTPCYPKDRGSIAYTGWDDIEICSPEGTTPGPSKTAHLISVRQSNGGHPLPSSVPGPEQRSQANRSSCRPLNSETSTSRVMVHRDPEPDQRGAPSRPYAAQGSAQAGRYGNQAKQNSKRQASTLTIKKPPTVPGYSRPTQGNAAYKTPLPQRVRQVRDSSVQIQPNLIRRSHSDTKINIDKKQAPTQMPSAFVWAEEPVSDVEMIEMADATTPAPNPSASIVQKKDNMSRSAILREAMVDFMLIESKESQEMGCSDDNKSTKDKGGKRGREVSSGSESSSSQKESYAEVAGEEPWLDAKGNRKKKAKVVEPMLELLGSKSEPTKEVFVLNLDYSRCRKPEQLEGMVKYFCNRRGIDVSFAKAYRSRSDPNDANCKIVVRESDAEKVMSDGFWPGNAYARPWYSNNDFYKGKNEKAKDDDGHSD